MTVSTSGNGITLQTNASAILRKGLEFSGTAPTQMAGQTIEIQRSGHQTNWTWANTVTATVGSDGTFNAVWQTDHIGQFAMRAVLATTSSQAEGASMTPSADHHRVPAVEGHRVRPRLLRQEHGLRPAAAAGHDRSSPTGRCGAASRSPSTTRAGR